MGRIWWYLAGGALAALGSWCAWRRTQDKSTQNEGDPGHVTARIRKQYDEMAPVYDRWISAFERMFLDGGREWAASQARGDVLEIATGTGRNLPCYGQHTRLSCLDLSPKMLAIARERAERQRAPVRLDVCDAQALDYPDGSFDSVICTLSLCTIPDPERALREVRRVLRPDGRFVAVEHVRSPVTVVRFVQRALDPLSMRFCDDHLLRDPLDLLEPLAFEIEQLERSKLGIIERVVARKPVTDSA